MRVTILGSAGSHPGPARVCSSYLLEHDGYRLLLDCGNGSLSNLQQVIDVGDLDQILLSHIHLDHWADLGGLFYALRFSRRGPQRVPLLAPAGAEAFIRQVLPPSTPFGDHLPTSVGAAGQRVQLGPLSVELFASAHPVETLASRISAGGRTLTYSADSGPTDALVDAARDADVFLCDATWLEADGPYPMDLHLTGAGAGRIAARAGVRHLVCTHVAPQNDPAEVVSEARTTFDGEVSAASDLDVLELA